MPKSRLGAETPAAAPLDPEAEEVAPPLEPPLEAPTPVADPPAAATVPVPEAPTALSRVAQVPEGEGTDVTIA